VPEVSVWLVRHGQSASNAGLPVHGHDEVPLTALGVAQAQIIALEIDAPPTLLVDSPFLRSRETADAIAARWPHTPRETWPIQEVTYLDPDKCVGTTVLTRQPMVEAFWRRCDPEYVDGAGAESFAHFMQRVADFDARLRTLAGAFVVVVGHGQFFAAYRFGLTHGFVPDAQWMRRYRNSETSTPLRNGEILKLRVDGVATYAQ